MNISSLPSCWRVTRGPQPKTQGRPLIISKPARTAEEQREATKSVVSLSWPSGLGPAAPLQKHAWSRARDGHRRPSRVRCHPDKRQAPAPQSTACYPSQVMLAPSSEDLGRLQALILSDLPQRTRIFSVCFKASSALLRQVPMAVSIPTGATALPAAGGVTPTPGGSPIPKPGQPRRRLAGRPGPAHATRTLQPLQHQARF